MCREPSVATVCFKVMLIFYVSDYKGVGGLPEPGVAGVGGWQPLIERGIFRMPAPIPSQLYKKLSMTKRPVQSGGLLV